MIEHRGHSETYDLPLKMETDSHVLMKFPLDAHSAPTDALEVLPKPQMDPSKLTEPAEPETEVLESEIARQEFKQQKQMLRRPKTQRTQKVHSYSKVIPSTEPDGYSETYAMPEQTDMDNSTETPGDLKMEEDLPMYSLVDTGPSDFPVTALEPTYAEVTTREAEDGVVQNDSPKPRDEMEDRKNDVAEV